MSLLQDRQRNTLEQTFPVQPVSEPPQRWSGWFRVSTENRAKGATFDMEAVLAMVGGCIDGSGVVSRFPTNSGRPSNDFKLEGRLSGSAVSFDIWVDHETTRNVPMQYTGVMATDETEITGSWELACMFPVTCNCNGSHGTFLLRKVEDRGNA